MALRTTLCATGTFFVAMLVSRVSLAQSTPPEFEPEGTWYGWQTLAMDGAVALSTVSVLTMAEDKDGYVLPLLAWYVVGVPIVHAIHRNGYFAAASVGMRLLAPPIGYAIGASLGGPASFPGSDEAGYGLLVGIGCAVLVDSLVFAWEPLESDDARLELAPSVWALPALGGHGPMLGGGVSGAF